MMLAETVSFGLSDVFLLVAIALFILSVIAGVARGWMLAAGLAFFAASFLSFIS